MHFLMSADLFQLVHTALWVVLIGIAALSLSRMAKQKNPTGKKWFRIEDIEDEDTDED